MSCAHAFGVWCQECASALARDYNALRVELSAVRKEIARLHELLADVDAVTDPETHSELHARMAAALDGSKCPPECSLRATIDFETHEQAETVKRALALAQSGYGADETRNLDGQAMMDICRAYLEECGQF